MKYLIAIAPCLLFFACSTHLSQKNEDDIGREPSSTSAVMSELQLFKGQENFDFNRNIIEVKLSIFANTARNKLLKSKEKKVQLKNQLDEAAEDVSELCGPWMGHATGCGETAMNAYNSLITEFRNDVATGNFDQAANRANNSIRTASRYLNN